MIIDVSKHNGKINWQQVAAAGVTDVIIRLSLGYGAIDSSALYHAQNASNAGVAVSYYHFAYPDKKIGGGVESDATAEAKYFVEQFSKGRMPAPRYLAVDLENWSETTDSSLAPSDYYKWLVVFLQTVLIETGIVPIVYSYASYLTGKLPQGHKLGAYPLWIANYSKDNPPLPTGWDRYFMHQYSAKGSVPGITGDVDLNRLYVSTLKLP